MSQTSQALTYSPAEVVRHASVQQAHNSICFAALGELNLSQNNLERMVGAVPVAVAHALRRHAFYFVPLALSEGEQTIIADRYDVALSDSAVCHRSVPLGDSQCVFISTRLMEDFFSIAFEFFINVGHAFVETAGVAQAFTDVVTRQVQEGARGETSMDAWELRKQITGAAPDERSRNEFYETVFADCIAIYLLSMCVDVDYYELREREYPLLAPAALAERLRKVSELFPPAPGYEFAIYYRRRS